MQKWLVEKFDYAATPKPRFLGTYWTLGDIHYFVDSAVGSDLNAGTYDAPFKTLSKAQTVGANGQEIMINGIFDESISLTKTIRWIGAGGGLGGRAIFAGNVVITTRAVYLDNIAVFKNGNYFIAIGGADVTLYASNCFFNACYFGVYQESNPSWYFYTYYCIFNAMYLYSYWNIYLYFVGNNNTLYSPTKATAASQFNFYGNNNHCNIAIYSSAGYNNITNVNGVYLDVTNWNFNFLNTSPLYRTGTYDSTTNNFRHVGAGNLGKNYNGGSSEFTAGGGATLTNISLSGTDMYRTSVASDGTVVTGYIDLGAVKKYVLLNVFNSYAQEGGVLQRLVQETDGYVDRNGLDYILWYGDTTGEVDTCPALLMEYGKIVTISGAGASRVGNADPTFDIATYTFPSFRYFKMQLREKTV